MKNVLVIIDMQNDFINGTLKNEDGEKVVTNIIKEIKSNKYDFIALTRDTHFDNYLNTLEGKNLPIEHCITRTEGWNIRKEIYDAVEKSGIQHKTYDKKSFGSFSLPHELEIYENELESVTVTGLCTDICVVSNALILRAELSNVPMYYIKDACAGTNKENHEAALRVMECCQIYNKEN